MTVQTSDNSITFIGNGISTVFPFNFRFFLDGDLTVTEIEADGTPVSRILDYNYTVQGAGSQNGGSITTSLPLPSGNRLTVLRVMPMTQLVDIRNQGAFFPEVHEDAFDRLTMLIQQNAQRIGRAIRVPDYDPEPERLPEVANRAFMLLSFDGDGNPVAVAAVNESATELAIRLSNINDPLNSASLVKLISGGSVAQAIQWVTPTMFGAANNGVDDDYSEITAAAAYASANSVELVLSGSYATSVTLDFSSVRKIRCINDAKIVPLMDTGVAVKWVAGSGLLIEKPVQEGDLHVEWPTRDWTKDRTSFLIQNIYNGRFALSSSRASRGLLLKGLEKGVVYNDIDIGVWANNLVGVWFSSGSATGWCNANRIFGGRFYGAEGVGAGNTVVGSIYETRAGHFYIETTPYACNGNAMIKPSIEWIGPDFRLARMGGLSNRLEPVYGELGSGDTTWIVDTGTNNMLDLTGVPSLSNGYDTDLSGAANRVDVSLATNPKVLGSNGLMSGVVCQTTRTNSPTRAAIRGENSGVGPAIEARSQNSASNPGLAVTGPTGAAGVLIPPAGVWTMFNGTKKVSWSMALAPATGDWTRGDMVFFTNPSPGGYIGAVCTTSGTPGTWKNWGAIVV